MKTIRIAALLLLLTTLAAPFHGSGSALAADTGRTSVSEPVTTPAIDPGTSPDTRAGVAAAVMCGTSVGLLMDTKYLGFIGMAVLFCGYMVFDAISTPDF